MKIGNISFISFRASISAQAYTDEYMEEDYNGSVPDKFVLERVGEAPPRKFVLDLGAGQGRNTIPIAQMGHAVVACEINPYGINDISVKRTTYNLQSKIRVLNCNILHKFSLFHSQQVDFALMSHISQHLNPNELRLVCRNVAEVLKTGGEFVFDALQRLPGYKMKKLDKILSQIEREERGCSNFCLEDILTAAKLEGFSLVEEALFQESSGKRASYETQKMWGGTGEIPVFLKWFVLRKK